MNDDDDETRTQASISYKIITRKREKKNAALTKLQGMLSMISSSQSDEVVRQNISLASTCSTSDVVAARGYPPVYSLTFSDSIDTDKSKMKKKAEPTENNK